MTSVDNSTDGFNMTSVDNNSTSNSSMLSLATNGTASDSNLYQHYSYGTDMGVI